MATFLAELSYSRFAEFTCLPHNLWHRSITPSKQLRWAWLPRES